MLAGLALVLGACASNRDEVVAEFGDSPATSVPSTTAPDSSSTSTTLLPPTVEEQLTGLEEIVEDIRGLQFSSEVPTVVRSADEVAEGYLRVRQRVGTEAEDYEEDFLTMLGVLEPNQSVADFSQDVTVPGYYDPAGRVLVLAPDIGELTPFGRLTLVEELTSALTDRAFNWSERMAALEADGDSEAMAGLQALVRGDAAFTGRLYADQHMTSTDRFAVQLELISRQQDRTIYPGYVAELDEFQAETAIALVELLVSEGGLPRLDAAYDSPPATSEQVYHSFQYVAREPAVPVELPDVRVSGFQKLDSGVLGERGLRAILSEGVNEAQRLQAATGWGGDAYQTWWNGEAVVMLVLFEGDTERDAEELGSTLGKWAIEELPVGAGLTDNRGLAFSGPDAYAFVAHEGSEVLFVVASDRDAGKQLRDRFWPTY